MLARYASATRMISIHAPVKGATGTAEQRRVRHQDFNPRSREGSDLGVHPVVQLMPISIHAPVKGATPMIL